MEAATGGVEPSTPTHAHDRHVDYFLSPEFDRFLSEQETAIAAMKKRMEQNGGLTQEQIDAQLYEAQQQHNQIHG